MAGGETHIVLYDASTGYVFSIWKILDTGGWQNSATWEADGYIQTTVAGIVARGFEDRDALGTLDTSNVKCALLTNPTLDESDWDRGGVLKVDNITTPTDTAERTDADRYEGEDYTYTV